MNDITKVLSSQFRPQMTVVVYECNSEYYLEVHEIVGGVVGASKPIDQDSIQDLVEYFDKKEKRDSGLSGPVPSGVLFIEWNEKKKVIAWTNPARSRPMFFTKELHIKNGVANQPSLLYVLRDTGLDIFAYQPKTGKLFQAPYHNVSSSGDVCLGSAKLVKPRDRKYASLINYYEDLFWKSEFSHLAGHESPIKGNLNTYWKKHIGKPEPFDYSVLIPYENKTLSKFIEKL